MSNFLSNTLGDMESGIHSLLHLTQMLHTLLPLLLIRSMMAQRGA